MAGSNMVSYCQELSEQNLNCKQINNACLLGINRVAPAADSNNPPLNIAGKRSRQIVHDISEV